MKETTFCTKDQLKEIEDNNLVAISYCDKEWFNR